MPLYRFVLFGAPRVELDGEPVKVDTNKTLALLIYLALNRQQHRRDSLAALLWPESDRTRGRALLRRSLYVLRKIVGDGRLVTDRETAALESGDDFDIDVDRFSGFLGECAAHGHDKQMVCVRCLEPLASAVDLYGGEFLAGFGLRDSVTFDEWQRAQSQNLYNDVVGGFARLLRCFEEAQDLAGGMTYVQKWLAVDPISEEAHRVLISLYSRSGRRSAAINQYESCARILKDQLGVSPSEETTSLFESIRAGGGPAVSSPENNLPRQLTSFVGRAQEISRLKQLLPATNVLTLTGPSGCGKTRLALETATGELPRFPDGVWLVELASLSDPNLVPLAVMSALDIHEHPGQSPTEVLSGYIRSKGMLIVLDNCEHLVWACGKLVTSLLQANQSLKFLVNGRERLHVSGEYEFLVPPLGVPNELSGREVIEQSEAVRLFCDRALAVRSNFELTDQNWAAIGEICIRLDGLPLAIELAAARLKILSPTALLEHLGDKLDVLKGDRLVYPERQQTLRRALDWSYELLDSDARALFERLSVFAGGFSLDAAAMAHGDGESVSSSDIIDGLSSLVDKSLLAQYEVTSTPRFQMLTIIREYAGEKLGMHGGAESAIERIASYFASLAIDAEPKLYGLDQSIWFARIDLEYDNIRMVLRWLHTNGRIDEGLQLAGALGWYWWRRGRFREGQEWLEAFLSSAHRANPTPGLGKVLYFLGWLQFLQGGFESTAHRAYFAKSVEVWQSVGDKRGEATALAMVGFWERQHGQTSLGCSHSDESVRLARRAGDPWTVATTLRLAYSSTRRDDVADNEVISALEEAVKLATETGDPYCLCDTLHGMGDVFRYRREHEKAISWFIESQNVAREMGDKFYICHNLRELGAEYFLLGDIPGAESRFREGLRLSAEFAVKGYVAMFLSNLSHTTHRKGDLPRAARLKGAARSIQMGIDGFGSARESDTLPVDDLDLEDPELAKEWVVGQSMTMDDAVAYGLAPSG